MLDRAYFGALVLDADPALAVEAAILAGSWSESWGGPANCSFSKCESWRGGYEHLWANEVVCNNGAGPLMEGSGHFYASGSEIFLPWLHTQPSRRTNLSFYNPDPIDAVVAVTISSASSSDSVRVNVAVPAHSVAQLNDVFSSPPFDVIRAHNGTASAAATASIHSTTRLYAIGWVISNENNTVSIAVPR